jgi:hypothetical protein
MASAFLPIAAGLGAQWIPEIGTVHHGPSGAMATAPWLLEIVGFWTLDSVARTLEQ